MAPRPLRVQKHLVPVAALGNNFIPFVLSIMYYKYWNKWMIIHLPIHLSILLSIYLSIHLYMEYGYLGKRGRLMKKKIYIAKQYENKDR